MAQNVLISDLVMQCLQLVRQAGEALKLSEQLKSSVLTSLEEQQVRFKLWSANIGAHRKGMSSLEYRVRDASTIRNQVVRLLEDLIEQMRDAIAIASGQKIPWDELPDEEEAEDDPELRGHDSEDNFPSTELDQISVDTTEIIDCLFRLNLAIRNPAPHDRFTKLADTSHFEPFDIQHVRSKFASLDPKLEERLGKAISRRRQYFKYREAHHAKLQHGLDEHDTQEDLEPPQSTIASSIPEHLKDSLQGQPARAPVLEEDQSDAGISQTSYATSVATAETLRVPPLPEAAYHGPFECPFCFMMIVASSRASWKKHVYGDLRPHICLEPDCVTPEREFSRRHEWMEHTKQAHWKTYVCPFGCPGIFKSSADCERHLKGKHPEAADDATLDVLVRAAAQPLDIQQGIPCLLCEETFTSEGLYQRHVGRHQEQLALFALPPLDSNDDEAEADDAVSEATGTASSLADLDVDQFLLDNAGLAKNVPLDVGLGEPERSLQTELGHENNPVDTELPQREAASAADELAMDEAKLASFEPKPAQLIGNDQAEYGRLTEQQNASEAADLVAKARATTEETSEPQATDGEAKASKKMEMEESIKKEADERVKAMVEEHNRRVENAPIKFKDAVGRKFSFPFHLCQTWAGMEELIRQAFMHVDVIGPHVQEGHYDLFGPSGEIIVPSVWEKVIKPGDAITMAMWPIDKDPSRATSAGSASGIRPLPPGPSGKRPHFPQISRPSLRGASRSGQQSRTQGASDEALVESQPRPPSTMFTFMAGGKAPKFSKKK